MLPGVPHKPKQEESQAAGVRGGASALVWTPGIVLLAVLFLRSVFYLACPTETVVLLRPGLDHPCVFQNAHFWGPDRSPELEFLEIHKAGLQQGTQMIQVFDKIEKPRLIAAVFNLFHLIAHIN